MLSNVGGSYILWKGLSYYIFNACYYPVYGMFTDKGKFNDDNFMNSIVTVKFTRLHIPHNYHIYSTTTVH